MSLSARPEVSLQLIAYYLGSLSGYNVDQPGIYLIQSWVNEPALVFVKIFAGNIVLGNFTGVNFLLFGVVSFFHS